MKKFFALMLVVAMLSVAGSAMAVTISVSGDKTATVQAGKAAGFTLVVSLDHSDVLKSLSVDVQSGTATNWADWVSGVTSKEVNFSVPSNTTASTYGFVVRARERWISGDTTGHSIEETDTATVRVSLDVAAAPLPPDEKVVTEDAKVVDVEKSVAVTVESSKASTTEKSSVETQKGNVITQLNAVDVADFAASAVPSDAVVQDGANMTAADTANYDAAGTDAAKVANLHKAAAMLKHLSGNDEERALGVVQPFTVANAGLQPLSLPVLPSVYHGRNIGMYMGGHEKGGNEVVFLNSKGSVVYTVPDSADSTVVAGKLLAVAYVEPSKTYTPILWTRVTAAEEASFDEATGTTTVKNIDIVVPVEEKKTVSSDTVFPTGKKFTFNVGSSDRVALEKAAGVSLDRLPASTTSSDQTPLIGFLDDGTYYYEEVALIPVLQNMAPNTGNHKYVVAFKYERQHGSLMTVAGAPVFNSNGASLTANGTLYAIDYSGTEAKASTAVAANTTDGNTGFLVFKVSGDAVATFSAANASFANPRVMARTTSEVSEGEPGASSSSGGCSAGSAALALAVLGSFILTRKK